MSHAPPASPPTYPPHTDIESGPPAPAPPPSMRTPMRIGVLFALAGIVLAVVGGVIIDKKSIGTVNGFDRIPVARGYGQLGFHDTGTFAIYYEAPTFDPATSPRPRLEVTLTGPIGPTQHRIVADQPYGSYPGTKTYNYGGHHGAAVYRFSIPSEGRYQVSIRVAPGSRVLPGADLAFGQPIDSGIVVGVGVLVLGVLLVLAGLVLMVVGVVRRGRPGEPARVASGTGPRPRQD